MTHRSLALLFSPIGLLLISAARLLIISDYNTTTATTVAASGGYINTLLGSVIPLVPVFIPYIALLLLVSKRFVLGIIAFAFTALIAPSPLSLPVTQSVASADVHALLTRVSQHWVITAIILAVIALAALHYHRSFIETVGTMLALIVALGLFLAPFIINISLPPTIRAATNGEHRLLAWIIEDLPRTGFFVLVIIALAGLYYSSVTETITTGVAIIVTLALFPYIYNVYPIPRRTSYYAAVLHQPWLPPEEFVLNSGHIYYGYALSTTAGWFTVLLGNSRTIAYVPAGDVVGQVVCQPRSQNQPQQYPPLVPFLYTPPKYVKPCPNLDRSTSLRSIQSHGESLNVISSLIHIPVERVIEVTNAIQNQRLSVGLRAYERSGNWNAPTPIGQHFWYYPLFKP